MSSISKHAQLDDNVSSGRLSVIQVPVPKFIVNWDPHILSVVSRKSRSLEKISLEASDEAELQRIFPDKTRSQLQQLVLGYAGITEYLISNATAHGRELEGIYRDMEVGIGIVLSNVEACLKDLYSIANMLYAVTTDSEGLQGNYETSVDEFGRETFIRGVLDYYGYDDSIKRRALESETLESIYPLLMKQRVTKKDRKMREKRLEEIIHKSKAIKQLKKEAQRKNRKIKSSALYFRPEFPGCGKVKAVCNYIMKTVQSHMTLESTTMLNVSLYHLENDRYMTLIKKGVHRIGCIPMVYDRTGKLIHMENLQCPSMGFQDALAFFITYLPLLKKEYDTIFQTDVTITTNTDNMSRSPYIPIQKALRQFQAGTVYFSYPEMPGILCKKTKLSVVPKVVSIQSSNLWG